MRGSDFGAVRFTVPARLEPVATPAVGLVNGLITGVIGTFVIPIVMYLEALGLDRDELVQMMGITFAVSTAALAGVLMLHGAYRVDAGLVSAAAVAPAIAGMMLGARLRALLTPRYLSHVAARRARRHRSEAARHRVKSHRRTLSRPELPISISSSHSENRRHSMDSRSPLRKD